MKDKITAILLAAGMGKRMNAGIAKQFMELKNKPVLYYSLKAFEESSVDEIILVTGKGQKEYCQDQIIGKYNIKKVSQLIEGGAERYDSVYNGLKKAENSTYVLIHDGARPFLSVPMIESCIEAVKKDKACILGTPVKETIKCTDKEGYIIETPDRKTLWSAQTPQGFDYQLILQAYNLLYKDHNDARMAITDDAMVYEKYIGNPVKVIMGDYNNIKLTTKEDYFSAQSIANELWK